MIIFCSIKACLGRNLDGSVITFLKCLHYVGMGSPEKFFCPVLVVCLSLQSMHSTKNGSIFCQHYMTVHAEKKNICGKCGKGFGLPDACRRHELKCGQLFTCSCGCPYTTIEALLTHAGRKMHKVPECYKTTKERYILYIIGVQWQLIF